MLRTSGQINGTDLTAGEHSRFGSLVSLAPKGTSRLHRLISRLKIALEDKNQYKQLLSCRDDRAQKLLDLFQVLLDTLGLDIDFKRALTVATQRLSNNSGLFPTCYNLEGVHYAGDPVAAGSFADIYQGDFRGRSVCIKVIRIYQTSQLEYLRKKFAKEAVLWGQLTHPNICPIYGIHIRQSGIMGLVSPWMDNGNLSGYLKQYPQASRALLICDAARGLLYLHAHGVVHGDLKGANILISASGRARLADFGLSSVSDVNILGWTSNSSAESKGGSIRWQAPELFDFESDEAVPNSEASDVYALASVCYEAFAGAIPFAHLSDFAVMHKVITGSRPLRPSDDSVSWNIWGLTEDIWSMMMDCWSTDPSSRPTVRELIKAFSQKLPYDQRPTDELSTISPISIREEVGICKDIISVDALESLAEIEAIPLDQTEVEKSQLAIIKSLKEALGNDHPDTVNIMIELLDVYAQQDRWQEAEELWLAVVESQKRTRGVNHPDAWNAMLKLASAYAEQDRWREAEELQSRVMKSQKQTLGMDRCDTLGIMIGLANIYSEQGRWKEVKELWILVMESRKRTLGIDHPDTLDAMLRLAAAYEKQDQWKEAAELWVVVMESRKRTLGVDHPDTLNAMLELAAAYMEQDQWKEVAELWFVVVEVRKRTLGVEHSDTLNAMLELLAAYEEQDRWGEAKELWIVVMESRKRSLGIDHPDTLDAMLRLAAAYEEQDQWKEAAELGVVVMESRKRTLGVDHPDTLNAILGLAAVYIEQDQWKEVAELWFVVVEVRKRTLGVEHSDTLDAMLGLAVVYKKQDRWKEAGELWIVLMESRKRKLGIDHPNTLDAMLELLAAYKEQDRWGEAEELCIALVESRKRNLGIDHPDTLSVMSELAAVYYKMQDRWKEATELWVDVMALRKKTLGPDHPDTLDVMLELAAAYKEQDQWKEAAELWAVVMESRKRTLGIDHPDTFDVIELLAAYEEQDRWSLRDAEALRGLVEKHKPSTDPTQDSRKGLMRKKRWPVSGTDDPDAPTKKYRKVDASNSLWY